MYTSLSSVPLQRILHNNTRLFYLSHSQYLSDDSMVEQTRRKKYPKKEEPCIPLSKYKAMTKKLAQSLDVECLVSSMSKAKDSLADGEDQPVDPGDQQQQAAKPLSTPKAPTFTQFHNDPPAIIAQYATTLLQWMAQRWVRHASLSIAQPQSVPTTSATAAGSNKASTPDKNRPIDARVKDGRISKPWQRIGGIKTYHTKGIVNEGVDCYRNSLMQVLVHQPAFFRYLLNSHQTCEHRDGKIESARMCAVCALQALFRVYWQTIFETPVQLDRALERSIQTFTRALKQDSNKSFCSREFMNDLLRNDQNDPFELLAFLVASLQEKERIDAAPQQANVTVSEADAPEDHRSTAELFKFELQRQWICEDCGNVTGYRDPVSDAVGLLVSIGSEERRTLLVEYLRGEIFADVVSITCTDGKCAGKLAMKKRQRKLLITRPPEILVIRLERGKQDLNAEGNVVMRKLRTKIGYEEYLNLGEYTVDEEPLMYRLDGCVAHQGSSTKGGHYVSAVREMDGKTFVCVDDNVKHSRWLGNVNEVERPRCGSETYDPESDSLRGGADPYILVYSRVRTPR
ncbi:hypothetical protein BAUCODRAFT_480558 [Baudoinia panamericana UAMH 10762]|uniref:USP domain-containing protein n=1 Tax=Baudoinia panamericana (strain UAMH 10762) TaxID=717646 RepID=M2LQ78_BAUPA|nr:uncharacterized protein BAUCODRAFT_480558 [Baudoinia panamericana UAMH 10762]EMC96557.1 hypothetical protein BAUCODRAFT_480558 [Baudoinia panamericana UAMH 10762]